MPERWLICYAEMLGRLQAEEHLGRVSELTAGDSWLDRQPRQQLLAGWQREARGPERRLREPERMTKAEFRRKLALMGFGFEEEELGPQPPEDGEVDG